MQAINTQTEYVRKTPHQQQNMTKTAILLKIIQQIIKRRAPLQPRLQSNLDPRLTNRVGAGFESSYMFTAFPDSGSAVSKDSQTKTPNSQADHTKDQTREESSKSGGSKQSKENRGSKSFAEDGSSRSSSRGCKNELKRTCISSMQICHRVFHKPKYVNTAERAACARQRPDGAAIASGTVCYSIHACPAYCLSCYSLCDIISVQ